METQNKQTNDNTQEKMWVIVFNDGMIEHYYKHEILYSDGGLDGYGNVMVFKTEEETERYIKENLDSREYDRLPKEITREELNQYEEWLKQ